MSQDKEREALEAAWRECRDACDPSDWTASEAAAYRGFFAHGYRAALATQPPAVQGEPLFLLHTGQIDSSREQDEWETEVHSGKRVDEFCRQHPGQTIGLYPHVQTPSREVEPPTELLIEAEFGSDSNESYPDFLAGVCFAERYYGIHSRGEGERA